MKDILWCWLGECADPTLKEWSVIANSWFPKPAKEQDGEPIPVTAQADIFTILIPIYNVWCWIFWKRLSDGITFATLTAWMDNWSLTDYFNYNTTFTVKDVVNKINVTGSGFNSAEVNSSTGDGKVYFNDTCSSSAAPLGEVQTTVAQEVTVGTYYLIVVWPADPGDYTLTLQTK